MSLTIIITLRLVTLFPSNFAATDFQLISNCLLYGSNAHFCNFAKNYDQYITTMSCKGK